MLLVPGCVIGSGLVAAYPKSQHQYHDRNATNEPQERQLGTLSVLRKQGKPIP